MKAIFFDDEAVKKELISFPPSEVDRRGNKRFHTHPAKQLLTDDIKNGAGETYLIVHAISGKLIGSKRLNASSSRKEGVAIVTS
jgi:hypothetical protein